MNLLGNRRAECIGRTRQSPGSCRRACRAARAGIGWACKCASSLRPGLGARVPAGAGTPTPELAHQIDLFCVPQLADIGCLEADHNGGYVRGWRR